MRHARNGGGAVLGERDAKLSNAPRSLEVTPVEQHKDDARAEQTLRKLVWKGIARLYRTLVEECRDANVAERPMNLSSRFC